MVAEPMSDAHEDDNAAGERLQKYLARCGVASRRHAEEIIAAGAVQVNGTIVRQPGTRIDPARDVVMLRGRRVQPVAHTITVALHKPVGYISTAHDPQGRPILADLLPQHVQTRRLVPVGRLDADSEGLILLSDDGDLTLRLTHPRYEAEKEYHALVEGVPDDAALAQLRHGVVLAGENERPTAPARLWRINGRAQPGQTWIAVALHEGRKRQVRLMFATLGMRVERLIRVRIGQLRLADVAPRPGMYRVLTDSDIQKALADSPGTHDVPSSR
jgi:23S rRNA pseudouridine2605 synthase